MLFIILILLLVPKDALSYVDPGSGSFFLQMLLAGTAGAFFYFRRFFAKLLFWKKKDSSDSNINSKN